MIRMPSWRAAMMSAGVAPASLVARTAARTSSSRISTSALVRVPVKRASFEVAGARRARVTSAGKVRGRERRGRGGCRSRPSRVRKQSRGPRAPEVSWGQVHWLRATVAPWGRLSLQDFIRTLYERLVESRRECQGMTVGASMIPTVDLAPLKRLDTPRCRLRWSEKHEGRDDGVRESHPRAEEHPRVHG